jgi:glycosyltransferase involved in cell wall biosynthesis
VTRRRLLFLTPFPPRLDGSHGGSRTIAHLLVRLAERHSLAIVTLRAPGDPPMDEQLLAAVDRYVEVPKPEPRSFAGRLLHWTRQRALLLHGVPLHVAGMAGKAYSAEVERVSADWKPDLVQIEFDVMGRFLGALGQTTAPRILVVHEPGLDAAREGRAPGGRVLRLLDVRAWRHFTHRLLSGVQAVVVFTERDRSSLEAIGGSASIVTIAPGVDVPPSSSAGSDPYGLLFVGNFIHPPNIDAALRLAAEIFPQVRARCPEATLRLVGPSPPEELLSLHGEGITIAGYVADVGPYLEEAALIVAPVREGGGIRIKVLEALAAGKAVVATPLAVEGLDLPVEEIVRVRETDEQLAACILELLHDPVRRQAMGERARRWTHSNLRWSDTVAAYERLHASLLGDEQSGLDEGDTATPPLRRASRDL